MPAQHLKLQAIDRKREQETHTKAGRRLEKALLESERVDESSQRRSHRRGLSATLTPLSPTLSRPQKGALSHSPFLFPLYHHPHHCFNPLPSQRSTPTPSQTLPTLTAQPPLTCSVSSSTERSTFTTSTFTPSHPSFPSSPWPRPRRELHLTQTTECPLSRST